MHAGCVDHIPHSFCLKRWQSVTGHTRLPFQSISTNRAAALPRASGVPEAGSFSVEASVRRYSQASVGIPCVLCNLQVFLGYYTDRLITRVAHSSYGARGSLPSTYSSSSRVQHQQMVLDLRIKQSILGLFSEKLGGEWYQQHSATGSTAHSAPSCSSP